MTGRRVGLLVVVVLLAAGCRVDAAPPVILGGAPDTSPAALAARRAVLTEPAGDIETSGPESGEEPPDLPADGTVPVLLLRDGEPVWVRRAAEVPTPDAVLEAVTALAEPLRPDEVQHGLTTAVELGTSLEGWNRRDSWLELGVGGAAHAGGTSTALRWRGLQIACTAMAALDPPPVGANFVTGAPLDGVAAVDCPPVPEP